MSGCASTSSGSPSTRDAGSVRTGMGNEATSSSAIRSRARSATGADMPPSPKRSRSSREPTSIRTLMRSSAGRPSGPALTRPCASRSPRITTTSTGSPGRFICTIAVSSWLTRTGRPSIATIRSPGCRCLRAGMFGMSAVTVTPSASAKRPAIWMPSAPRGASTIRERPTARSRRCASTERPPRESASHTWSSGTAGSRSAAVARARVAWSSASSSSTSAATRGSGTTVASASGRQGSGSRDCAMDSGAIAAASTAAARISAPRTTRPCPRSMRSSGRRRRGRRPPAAARSGRTSPRGRRSPACTPRS